MTFTVAERAEVLRACESQNCDGETHECWNCGGTGFVEPADWQDGDEEPCGHCRGRGGWPCPLLREGACS
jgi:hypothetical protein